MPKINQENRRTNQSSFESDEVLRADSLMNDGKCEEGKAVLNDLLKNGPLKKGTYQSMVAVYLLCNAYQEAKNVFAVYRATTNKDLTGSGFSIKDIEKEEQAYLEAKQSYENQPIKVFNQDSLWHGLKAGYLSMAIIFHRVKQIILSDGGIVFKLKNNQELKYKWSEILEMRIRKVEWSTKYRETWVVKTLLIKTKDKVFKIDVTDAFNSAEFKNTPIFLAELKKHKEIVEESVRKNKGWFWRSTR
ncbi:MAG: hypothetical protein NTV62_04280 [Candidatus Gribaldobacteria bacterium]|nr:hypothetical protein [Candidatus Gribaldobacteria bacterium]